ncbi:MAG: hypothetical protein NWE75_03335 [Candidatus Bathyarchaeota archaeon]|nr:hypothetical protein [Candidatus Bathyarchaeota archaeon]
MRELWARSIAPRRVSEREIARDSPEGVGVSPFFLYEDGIPCHFSVQLASYSRRPIGGRKIVDPMRRIDREEGKTFSS